MRTRFTIHVCPVCDFYDADPILKRVPGGRHAPKRCFRCGQKAADALDLTRVHPSFKAWKREQAQKSAPVMFPTEVVRAEGRA